MQCKDTAVRVSLEEMGQSIRRREVRGVGEVKLPLNSEIRGAGPPLMETHRVSLESLGCVPSTALEPAAGGSHFGGVCGSWELTEPVFSSAPTSSEC